MPTLPCFTIPTSGQVAIIFKGMDKNHDSKVDMTELSAAGKELFKALKDHVPEPVLMHLGNEVGKYVMTHGGSVTLPEAEAGI